MKKILSILTGRLFITFALIALQAWVLFYIMFSLGELSLLIMSCLSIAGIFVVIYITSKHENPAYKIGWIILILTIPIFGVPMYFLFSQPKLGKKAKNKAAQIHKKIIEITSSNTAAEELLTKKDNAAARQSSFINHTGIYPLYANTETKFYPMGEDFYADLLIELEKAEKYIFMEYFIIHEGKMWSGILDVLERKVAQGVEVRFMYDDMGCIGTVPRGYYKKIREKGINCQVFNPVRPVLNSLFNNRDHRKITVIDGKVGFCGGVNLADEYINEIVRFGVWKDATMMVKGEAVFSLLTIFMSLWSHTVNDMNIDLSKYELPEISNTINTDLGFVQPYADAPFNQSNHISEGIFMNIILRAEKYIYINTPYLVLPNEIITALATAAKSGVDVRITVPHIPDKKMVFSVMHAHYPQLIEAGVKIYEYTPGFVHSKTIVSDDKYGVVGTVNLDFRSLYLNFECGVWMYKTPIVADIKSDYIETLKICQEITLEDVQNVPLFKRFIRAILRIFGPLM